MEGGGGMLVILALRRKRERNRCKIEANLVYKKLQARQGYIVRRSLKTCMHTDTPHSPPPQIHRGFIYNFRV